MDDSGVATGIHFIPVHRHSYFRDCRTDDLRVTEQVCEEVVTLPLHSAMPPHFVNRVVDAVTSFKP
jgi:dTDP-4-amino-4,6-dideoxygalactose transaminase